MKARALVTLALVAFTELTRPYSVLKARPRVQAENEQAPHNCIIASTRGDSVGRSMSSSPRTCC